MKKITIITLVCMVFLLLSGCGFVKISKKQPETDTKVTAEASQPSESKKKENKKAKGPRTVDISAGIKDEGYGYSYEYDFDFDGKKEKVIMKVCESDPNSGESMLEVTIGNYTKRLELFDGSIEKVYACDIDTDDGVMNLAFITCEGSGDPRIRILKYDSAMTPCMFKTIYPDSEPYIEDGLWLGYAVSYYFNVNEDDSLCMEAQTSSAGMWSVHKIYREKNGFYTEVVPETYKVLPDFMEDRILYDDRLTGEELEKWKDGFIKAYTGYAGDGITLSFGDYFKVHADDGQNNLYIEKESGEKGWINIDYTNPNRYELNEFYFFLAG